MNYRIQWIILGVLALVVIALVSWESRYYFHESRSGEVYRINRITGSVVTLDALLARPSPSKSRSLKNLDKLTLPKNGGGTTANLSIKWQGGSLIYHLMISSITAQIKKAEESVSSNYTLQLQDSDGFPVAKDAIPLHSFTEIDDASGKPGSEDYFGSILMSVETYDRIAGWTLVWFFPAQ